MKIVVIGAGYVGLVTALGCAEFGNDVMCVDSNQERIVPLQRGGVPFYEPGLESLLKNNYAKRLNFLAHMGQTEFDWADVIFVAVGTPQSESGEADTSDLYRFIESLNRYSINSDKLVVLKSTVPVGTGSFVKNHILRSRYFHVANNPEFLREGTAVEDFLRPDRVVIGVDDKWSEDTLKRLYEPACCPVFTMDHSSAELSKYTSNCMIAMRISFMNEIAGIAEACNADVNKVREAVGADSRIGRRYLYPGPGFGGSCFTKDLNALAHTADSYSVHHDLISATLAVNSNQKQLVVDKISNALGGQISGKKIAVWGLSFKPLTDDMRDAPSLTVVNLLVKSGARVFVHDPQAIGNAMPIFNGSVTYPKVGESHYDMAKDADVVVLLTEWREYRTLDFARFQKLSPNAVFVDTRNVMNEGLFAQNGIKYIQIGKKSSM
jgi:UDPglucose 6-dehydrogenase